MNRVTIKGRVSIMETNQEKIKDDHEFIVKMIVRDERGLSEFLDVIITKDQFVGLGSWRIREERDLRGRELIVDGRIIRKRISSGDQEFDSLIIRALNIDLWES